MPGTGCLVCQPGSILLDHGQSALLGDPQAPNPDLRARGSCREGNTDPET